MNRVKTSWTYSIAIINEGEEKESKNKLEDKEHKPTLEPKTREPVQKDKRDAIQAKKRRKKRKVRHFYCTASMRIFFSGEFKNKHIGLVSFMGVLHDM